MVYVAIALAGVGAPLVGMLTLGRASTFEHPGGATVIWERSATRVRSNGDGNGFA